MLRNELFAKAQRFGNDPSRHRPERILVDVAQVTNSQGRAVLVPDPEELEDALDKTTQP